MKWNKNMKNQKKLSNVNKWDFEGDKLLSFFGIIKIIKEDHVYATLETKCTECDELNWGRSKDKDTCDCLLYTSPSPRDRG